MGREGRKVKREPNKCEGGRGQARDSEGRAWSSFLSINREIFTLSLLQVEINSETFVIWKLNKRYSNI